MKRRFFILIAACAAVITACSVFRVTAGKVTYSDPRRTVEVSADSLTIVK